MYKVYRESPYDGNDKCKVAGCRNLSSFVADCINTPFGAYTTPETFCIGCMDKLNRKKTVGSGGMFYKKAE